MWKGLCCLCSDMSQQAADRSREKRRVTPRSQGKKGLDHGQGNDTRMQPSLGVMSLYLKRAGSTPASSMPGSARPSPRVNAFPVYTN